MISMMRHPARPPHVALADHFANPASSRHPLRIRLTSGEEFDCRAPCFDVDHLVLSVTTSEGDVRKVRPADIQVVYERRPRWPAYAGLSVTTVAMGAAMSAVLVPLLAPLTAADGPLELVDVQALVDASTHPWYNQTLCKVNDSVVRLGVVRGEYHWHQHDAEDEFFYVVAGRFIVDLEGRSIELAPRQGFVVPRGVRHRTRAPERTVVLMVEGAGIVPTGD